MEKEEEETVRGPSQLQKATGLICGGQKIWTLKKKKSYCISNVLIMLCIFYHIIYIYIYIYIYNRNL